MSQARLGQAIIASISFVKTAMPGNYVVDASVAAKLYYQEEQSDQAAAALRNADHLIAPELLYLEMASIAAKRTRRGTSSPEQGALAVRSVADILDELIPLAGLASRAYDLASVHGFSAYDGAYLALAEARGFKLLTADLKLARLAAQVGLGVHVETLAGAI